MKPSSQLIEYLDRTLLPWMHYDHEKQKLIIVADNHLFSMYRACPQHFMYYAIGGYSKRSGIVENEVQRSWFLDFGILVHKMIELYYKEFRKENFSLISWSSARAATEWMAAKMDIHSEHKEYKLIGGVHGFIGLLIQFGTVFTPQNEKIRVIGQEISFGRRGEVPLHIDDDIEIYLAGRIDLVVDDGYFICPMDHKTMGTFRNDPAHQFLVDDGPTGYVYALSKILPQIIPEDMILKRDCSKILMNLISKKPTDKPEERFRRIPLRKTSYDLESYRLRMVRTARHIYDDMEMLVVGSPVYRNTFVCTNWKFAECNYLDVCRQGSPEMEQATLKNGFVQIALWDTEKIAPTT